MASKQFLTLLIFFFSYAWLNSFSRSALAPHFLNQGYSVAQIIFSLVFTFLGASLIQIVFRTFNSRYAWPASFICAYLFILSIINIQSELQLYLASTLAGFAIVLFFIPYNTLHFQSTPQHRIGISSAILFTVGPIISLVAPLAAGWLAEVNYLYVWVLSGVFFLLSLYLIKFQQHIVIRSNLRENFNYIKATRGLVFLQGIWEALVTGIIPIFGLYFISTPLYYGGYLAYLSLASIIANLIFGKISDMKQKRLIFIYPIVAIMSVTTLFFPKALNNLPLWLVVTGIIQFLMPLFWSFTTSIFVDAHPQVEKTFSIREILLNTGRTIGLLLIWLNFYFQPTPTAIFPFFSLTLVLFLLIIFYQTKVSKQYRYL